MPQHDYTIANQSFPNTRSDLNNSLSAIVSNNSGATEPTTTYAYQWWYDETTDILKMRNADNDAWITMFTFNQTTDTYSLATDVELTITENLDLTGNATISGDLTVDTDTLYVDSSNNRVGVGTTSPSVTFDAEADGATVAHFNRATSDGDIIELQKDGTTIGSIGYTSIGFYIDGESAHSGIRFGASQYVPKVNGSDSDNGVSLGTAVARFKDLYLGGNIYLGGTGSANALDDYEEGTWTPEAKFSAANPTAGATAGTGSYTKLGNMVTIWGAVTNINVTGASGDVRIQNVPFTSTSDATLVGYQGTAKLDRVDFATGYVTAEIPDNTTYVRFPENRDNTSTDFIRVSTCTDGLTDFYFTVTYKTDS